MYALCASLFGGSAVAACVGAASGRMPTLAVVSFCAGTAVAAGGAAMLGKAAVAAAAG